MTATRDQATPDRSGSPSTLRRASVVVCAHTEERWDDINQCIASVLAQVPAPDELVLVIDHNPVLLERAREAFGGDVEVVDNPDAKGEPGARNTGLKHTTGEVVVFIDDDAVADPRWLAALVSQYDDPKVAVVGGRSVPRWDTARPDWFPPEFDWVVGCSYRGMPERAAPVRNVHGANMSFRRSVLEELGGFSPQLGRFGDDAGGCMETEMCIRILQDRGPGSVVYEPAAVVGHRVPAARTSFAYFRRRCLAEGRSKARLATLVGSGDALADERKHVVRLLGRSVASDLADVARQRSLDGARRAGAVVSGLALTSWSYGSTALALRRSGGPRAGTPRGGDA